MRKTRKPRPRNSAAPAREKLTRRAILAALGAGVAARSLRAEAESKSTETIPQWVTTLSKCTSKYIAETHWTAEKEFLALKVLRLRIDELENHQLTVARDQATPIPSK
jgi:hypothetical protein